MATFLINIRFIVDVASLSEHFPSKISIIKGEEEKQTVSRQIWVQVCPICWLKASDGGIFTRKSIRVDDTAKGEDL